MGYRSFNLKPHKNKPVKEPDGNDKIPRIETIIFIILLLLFLSLILFTGGGRNNQGWYPGKPYYEH